MLRNKHLQRAQPLVRTPKKEVETPTTTATTGTPAAASKPTTTTSAQPAVSKPPVTLATQPATSKPTTTATTQAIGSKSITPATAQPAVSKAGVTLHEIAVVVRTSMRLSVRHPFDERAVD